MHNITHKDTIMTIPQQSSTDSTLPAASTADLKKEAEAQLKRLLHQERHIGKLQSNLDIIMKRHHIERSYLSLISEWYATKAWWIKISLGISITSTAAAIGVVFNLAIVLGAVASTLYLGISYLLQNDHDVKIARDKRLQDDIQQMEQDLSYTVDHLRSLEVSLKEVLISLCELNSHMADDILTFEEKISKLQTNVTHFTEVIQQLEKTNADLTQTNEAIKQNFEKISADLDKTNQGLSAESDNLAQVNKDFEQTQQNLTADHMIMNQVSEAFHESTHQLTEFADLLQTLLPQLQAQATSDKKEHDVLLHQLKTSVDDTIEIQSTSNHVITHAESTLSQALKELEDFEHFQSQQAKDLVNLLGEKNRHKTYYRASDTVLNQHHKTVHVQPSISLTQ
jgi:uncharacterized phage infection (PIP) family protein YhgE